MFEFVQELIKLEIIIRYVNEMKLIVYIGYPIVMYVMYMNV